MTAKVFRRRVFYHYAMGNERYYHRDGSIWTCGYHYNIIRIYFLGVQIMSWRKVVEHYHKTGDLK